AALHRDRVAAGRGRYNPQTLSRMEPGFPASAVDYVRALAARAPLLRRFCAELFADADLLALPTCPVPTPGIAETDTGGDARFTAVANRLGILVGPFNLLGLPAINVPAGLDRRGLPVGVQLVAPPFGEGLLLRAAHALEGIGGILAPPPLPARR
ncbi:MAG: amidase family protein, partial [Geminicoccaceae bacterium]